MNRYALTIAVVLELFSVGSRADADVTVRCVTPCTVQQYYIAITGVIDRQTVQQFETAAADQRITANTLPLVGLDSPGGSVIAAMAVGQLIRHKNMAAGVLQRATCSSACVLILAGGVSRFVSPDGKIGIGRKQYEAFQSIGRINVACWNAFGLNADRCKDELPRYRQEIESCPKTLEDADYVSCVRAVERRAIPTYQ
jgi:hypothetical protein